MESMWHTDMVLQYHLLLRLFDALGSDEMYFYWLLVAMPSENHVDDCMLDRIAVCSYNDPAQKSMVASANGFRTTMGVSRFC